MTVFDAFERKAFFKILREKGENAGKQYFSVFHNVLYHKEKNNVLSNTSFGLSCQFGPRLSDISLCEEKKKKHENKLCL